MKSALVLGLALTASAFSADQFDNELIVAPTDQFGNIKNYPRNLRFDEQADDELLVKRPGFLQVADDELRIAPNDEFARTKPYPPNIKFDEEGNELFLGFSFSTPRYGNLTNRFPGIYADDELMRGPYQRRRRSIDRERRNDFHDEVDNEFAFSPYRITVPSGGKKENDNGADNEYAARVKAAAKKYRPGLVEHVNQHPETVFFDEADDELLVRPDVPYVTADDAFHAKSAMGGLKPKLFAQSRAEALREDDELLARSGYLQIADDELIKPPKKNKPKGNVMYDDEVDNELHSNDILSELRFKMATSMGHLGIFQSLGEKLARAPPSDKKETRNVKHDDEADDELLIRPVVPYVTADDELHKMSPKLFTERRAEALRRDNEVDDELALLDDLLQEVSYNGGLIRWLDDADYEFRAEKKAHLKDRVRDHEMPEIRGKIKPLGDGGFLPFN